MNIVCVIDHLGAGGAQRQLATLGVHLKRSGHQVSFVTYHDDRFFASLLEEAEIGIHQLGPLPRLKRPFALKRKLKSLMPDAVLAFLEGPCLYCELAGLPSRSWGLVVSERLQIGSPKWLPDWHRLFHHLADYVTTNSHATRLALIGTMPRLECKVATVYNCLDLNQFRPGSHRASQACKPIRFVIVARYEARKNLLALVEALALTYRQRPNLKVNIDCYGGLPHGRKGGWDRAYFEQLQRAIRNANLQESFQLHEREADIASRFQQADALILPSLIEGLPNAICEAMASGLAVLASRIGDAEMLVQDGLNGFLFDPHSPEDIARAILDYCALPLFARAQMRTESRKRAETLFAPASAVGAYETLLEAAASRRSIGLPHWPPAASVPSPIRAAELSWAQ